MSLEITTGQSAQSLRQQLEALKEDWNLTDQDITSSLAQILGDSVPIPNEFKERKLILFLYARAGFGHLGRTQRVAYCEWILTADEYEGSLTRLETIVINRNDSPSQTEPSKIKLLFKDFMDRLPEWSKDGSYVIFRDHPLLKDKPHAHVERFQLSGLCYMHAPIVMQHYLVAMHTEDQTPMLDMTLYLRRYMSSPDLYDHIWNDRGGDSWDFLLKILHDTPSDYVEDAQMVVYGRGHKRPTDEGLIHSLENDGPGLVSSFQVHTDFENQDIRQHTGAPHGELVGLHAIVVVGFRKEGDSYRYLLQNWWRHKPYMEVDLEYLYSCRAVIRFIKKKQTQMGAYPTCSLTSAECNADVGERHLQESRP